MPLWPEVLIGLEWLIRLTMLPVVIRRKSQPAVCLAWLTAIFLVPFAGLFAYLLVGEVRLGTRRIRRHARDIVRATGRCRSDAESEHAVQPAIEQHDHVILHVAERLGGLPVLGGNCAELLTESGTVIDRLIEDIDGAERHVHLLFYIFAADEVGGRVADALSRARQRGVACRLLADAVGSHRFFRSLAPSLVRQGIEVVAALPVSPLRRQFARIDLRNHRKLAVIDGRIAYTGSQNMVRPDYGRKGVGEWRDVMVRITGPTVHQLQAVFLEDWEFETGESLEAAVCFPPPDTSGRAVLQVVPSGPNSPTQVLRDLSVEALHSARRRVVIVTPYFVPDEALLVALRLAVVRGVQVDLIVPARSDQLFVGLAAQFFVEVVLTYGVRVHLYQQGLLHVKAMTVDDEFAMLGTANFDVRSFYLNFELNLLSFDADLNGSLHRYQTKCMSESTAVDLATWRERDRLQQWGSQFAKLLSPLL